MKWLEIIELRSAVLDNSTLMDQLTHILKEINTEQKKNKIKLFSSNTVETDFSVHIEYNSGSLIGKSKLGHHINLTLKNFGFTNHKIWVKIENEEKNRTVE